MKHAHARGGEEQLCIPGSITNVFINFFFHFTVKVLVRNWSRVGTMCMWYLLQV